MKNLTISALDSLFNYLNNPEHVFWIRDKTYKKQIYISPSFEKLWGIPTMRLYEDTEGELTKSSLIQDDGKDKWLALLERKRAHANNQNTVAPSANSGELLLRIKDADGKEHYLFDRNFLLLDEKGQHLGFAGLVQPVAKEEWYALYYAEKSKFQFDSQEALKKNIFDSLYKEAGILAASKETDQSKQQQIPTYFITLANKAILFTKRESECIYYTKEGKSAKQIADILNISPRTVEFHLANAGEKANCRSKLALLTQVKTNLSLIRDR